MLTTHAQSLETAGILEAITALKDDFGSKFDGVLAAVNGIKSDFKDFSGRLGQAGDRIGGVEDDVAGHKTKIEALEKKVSEHTSKMDDLENRNPRSNLRLVNLLERVKKGNAVAFLEKWLPDALGPETFPAPLIIERAPISQITGRAAFLCSTSHDNEVLTFSRQGLPCGPVVTTFNAGHGDRGAEKKERDTFTEQEVLKP
ncbi:hypothetical protein AAFF_G00275830 [Aldrovandia affinis]|uniref:Uncharacterized protein n=1 Tax=Aldrovandia affinis TaxID=143900 RepID=A0AAD7W274_9TELE|nr:hypothetical protein AAFF_G00275830 [Aldrovandia affinis]